MGRLLKLLGLALVLVAAIWLVWRLWPADPVPMPAGNAGYLDMHVHVAGLGGGDSGCFVHPRMRENFRFPFLLRAMGVTVEELEREGDAILVQRLSDRIAASRRVAGAVVLALDGVVDANGELDRERTVVYVPNDYVADQTDRYANLHFGASINPYRPDAVSRLEEAHRRGAVLVKWIPAIMQIDPADERIIPFYRRMATLGIPLLSHVGQERSFPDANDLLGDPRRLELPLSLGVTVIAAHIATTGEYDGQDSFERLLPMFAEYPNLYSDISSLTQINKLGYLEAALTTPGLTDRLLYGSDWPLQFVPLVHALYQWPEISISQARGIMELDNPWDRDVAIKSAAGVPAAVFERSATLLLRGEG